MPKNLSLLNCKYNASSSITSIPKIFVIKVVILPGRGKRDILRMSGWACATGTLEPLAYTRASSAEFCYPILE